MSNYICVLDLQENIYKKIAKTYYVSAGLGDLSMDVFDLINCIAYGLHLWYQIYVFQ